jgi:ribosomal protein L29
VKLHKKSALELQNELMSLRKEQFALRLQRATGQAGQARPVRQGAQEHCAREDGAARAARWRQEGMSTETTADKAVRTLTGQVVSNKMDKTIAVDRARREASDLRQVRAPHHQAAGAR